MIEKSSALVSKKVFTPFILVTSLFALWGFANDITNPMVAAFGTLMELSNAKAAWVQLAFMVAMQQWLYHCNFCKKI